MKNVWNLGISLTLAKILSTNYYGIPPRLRVLFRLTNTFQWCNFRRSLLPGALLVVK